MTVARVCLCAAIIVGRPCACVGSGFRLGLPAFIVKYGGSVLWGAMVFFLVALAGSRLSRPDIALIAAAIAIVVELFRLVHTPALDAFRLTLAGALLLGRIFSPGTWWPMASGSCWRWRSTISQRGARRQCARQLSIKSVTRSSPGRLFGLHRVAGGILGDPDDLP